MPADRSVAVQAVFLWRVEFSPIRSVDADHPVPGAPGVTKYQRLIPTIGAFLFGKFMMKVSLNEVESIVAGDGWLLGWRKVWRKTSNAAVWLSAGIGWLARHLSAIEPPPARRLPAGR